MTAEIVLMNREAIALAADSAVTMNTKRMPKIFPSANKIFTLSKYNPVGIMIYGNAIFMGTPWETIIKVYREKLCKRAFATLEDYAKDFMGFLDNNNILFSESVQEIYIKDSIQAYLSYINARIFESVKSKIKDKGKINEIERDEIIAEILEEQKHIWENESGKIPNVPDDFELNLAGKYNAIIQDAINYTFEDLPLSSVYKIRLKELVIFCLSRFSNVESSNTTGIVIAGFGEDDIFPSLISYKLELVINNKLKYKMELNDKISVGMNASISAFAQSEMVIAFMEGVDPKYKQIKDSYISQIFEKYPEIVLSHIEGLSEDKKKDLENKLKAASDQLFKDLSAKLEDYRKIHHTNPIISVVSGLPKDELAKMAEALVNLTSFKRRVSPESETVGGPIDVAIISKGDGFIWVKRKHYFAGEPNPQFRENYYRRCDADGKK